MKRLALLVGLTLLTVVGTAATSQAYYLDTPHNESNGIFCYTCHTSEWYSYTPTGGIDDTLYNHVCLSCHDENPTDLAHQGPSKHLHASSTTSTDLGTWSTGCNQCHDPHFQGQLDWANDANSWVALGVFNNAGDANRTFNALDPLGDGYGTTTVSFDGLAVGSWDPATWDKKGGNMDPTRAVDGTRGLILAYPYSAPGSAYEIVAATANSVTVKGNMTAAPDNVTFGVAYGQLLRSAVFPNGGTTVKDYRDVRFYQPAIVSGTYGGYIDETPAAPKPQGLCQVCHTTTQAWTTDGTLQNATVNGQPHNPSNLACNTCHDILTGGSGAPAHSTFIVTDTLASKSMACTACHTAYSSPETAHVNSCNTCHTTTPVLNTNSMVNDAGTVLGNINTAGYTGGTSGVRLADSTGKAIFDVGFNVIECGICHVDHPGDANHGGHADTDFAWDSNCSDCHSATPFSPTENIAKDIHGDVCTTCHAAGDFTTRVEGDPANGIDGDARGATVLTTCTGCHSVNTPGVVHHVSASGYAAAGNCAVCHGTSGHEGNHQAEIQTYANCSSCHGTNVPAATAYAAPVNSGDPKVHNSCVTCHNTDTTLKSLAQANVNGYVIAMPNPAGSGNGGGTCADCHGEYFDSHVNIDHTTGRIEGAPTCTACHTATAGTATGAPVNSGDNKVHDACSTCHATNGLLKSITATYGGTAPIAGGACTGCHGAYFPSHVSPDHSARVAVSSYCVLCHDATKGLATGMPINNTDPKMHDACNTCHDDATNNLLKAGYGTAPDMVSPGGDCVACHNTYFVSHGHTHLVSATTACASCHDATGSGAARAANTAPYIGAGEVHEAGTCSKCHDITDGSFVAQVSGATATGAGSTYQCIDCHTTGWVARHTLADTATLHATLVQDTTPCSDCHNATAANGLKVGTVTPFLAANEVHNTTTNTTGGCNTCHTGADDGGVYVDAAVPAKAPNLTAAGGTCEDCHGIFDNIHAGRTHNVSYNAAVDLAQSAPGTGCGVCHDGIAPNGDSISGDGDSVSFNTWTDIFMEHNNSCGTCHTYDGIGTTGDAGTPPEADVLATIAAGSGTCVSCHTLKVQPASHGGHSDTNFVWDGNCDDCHSATPGTPTEVVVKDIHADNCDLCHVGGDYSASGNGVGPAAAGFGIDGDAGLAEVLKFSAGCTTCHAPGSGSVDAGSVGGIHHNNKNGNTDCTTSCHTVANHRGSHNTTVANASNPNPACATQCHTSSAEGLANGSIPVSLADKFIHDSCTTCHEFNPTGWAGQMETTIPAGGNVGAIAGGAGDCTKCHSATFKGTIHHDTAIAAGNNCTYCHNITNQDGTNGMAFDHSGTSLNTNASCNASFCHNGADDPANGNATGVNVAFDNPMIHDSCRTCHTFSSLQGVLVASPGTKGVTTMALTGTCTSCHTAAPAVFHHLNPNSAQGTCSYCHHDPRNDGVGTSNANDGTYEENGFTAPTKQLICDECHVTPISFTGGWNQAGSMVISAWNEGGTHATNNYSYDFTRTVANTGGHSIPNTAGLVDNWGICFGCHDATPTVGIKVLHAQPTGMGTCVAMFNPGVRATGSIGRTYFLGASWRPTSTNFVTTGDGLWASRCNNNPANDGFTAAVTIGTGVRGALTSWLSPDPFGANQNNDYVPLWSTNINVAGNIVTPDADNVQVVSAEWDGTNINVSATHTDNNGCGNLSVSGNAMSGTEPNCSVSFVSAYVATIDVITTNGDGINVTAYPVADVAAPTPATAADDLNIPVADSAGGNTVLDVLANDIGTALTISAVSAVSGANCGTITNNTTSLTYVPSATGTATCTFTYDAQAWDGVTPLGSASTANVSLDQSANQAPAFGSASYTMAGGNVGVAYSDSIAGFATDPESDPITYSKTGGTCTWASVSGAGAVTGTPGSAGACTVLVTATATGGSDSATLNITVASVTPYADWTETWNSAPAGREIAYNNASWTWQSGATGTNYWFTTSNGTASGSGGPGGQFDGIFAYVECSNGIASGDSSWLELSGADALDASTYNYQLEFEYNLMQGDSATTMSLYYDNGSGWTQYGGSPLVTGNTNSTNGGDANGWVHIGPLDLSALSNGSLSLRIETTVSTAGGAKVWNNDPSFDSIFINGTP